MVKLIVIRNTFCYYKLLFTEPFKTILCSLRLRESILFFGAVRKWLKSKSIHMESVSLASIGTSWRPSRVNCTILFDSSLIIEMKALMIIEKLRENDKRLYCVMQSSTRISPRTTNRTAFKIALSFFLVISHNFYRHATQPNY